MSSPEPGSFTLRELFAAFFRIGSLAFGGGGSTLAMMHQEFCVRRPAVDEEHFQLLFGLSRVVPGMNLISLTVLLGHHLGGMPGVFVALFGLTLPCFVLIVLGCLLFRGGHLHPALTGALRGLTPAATAVLGYTLWQLSDKPLRRQSWAGRGLWLALFLGTAALAWARVLHPAWLLVGAGVCGWLVSLRVEVRA
jgi:chromate transporter